MSGWLEPVSEPTVHMRRPSRLNFMRLLFANMRKLPSGPMASEVAAMAVPGSRRGSNDVHRPSFSREMRMPRSWGS